MDLERHRRITSRRRVPTSPPSARSRASRSTRQDAASDLAGVTVVDPQTVDVELTSTVRPVPSDRGGAADSAEHVYGRSRSPEWSQDPDDSIPNGTGPFKIGEVKPTRVGDISRRYQNQLTAAKVDKIIVSATVRRGHASPAAEGRHDRRRGGGGPAPGGGLDGNPDISVKQLPSITYDYVSFDLDPSPFQDLRVRQALSYGIDTAAIGKALYFGRYRLANGPIRPDSSRAYDATVPRFDYDRKGPGAAYGGWLSARSGRHPQDGQPFKVSFITDVAERDMGVAILPYLKTSGSTYRRADETDGFLTRRFVVGKFDIALHS